MPARTAKGSVTSIERKLSGIDGTGKYPVFDRQSALAALKLRHNSKTITASAVISKVARWAQQHNDSTVQAAVATARQEDAGK